MQLVAGGDLFRGRELLENIVENYPRKIGEVFTDGDKQLI